MLYMVKLSEENIREWLKLLQGWKYENSSLVKEFKFRDFSASVKFVDLVRPVADSMDHHPDICISYNKVVVTLTTHDEGGVTELDVKLAEKIEELQRYV
ncbi:pterin-4a-carbinolamine dehydratase [Metallosphaera yellowstonensis MK1]|jgi:4a-hydroxytetrahydrobiopterin dehydratase|uniref:Putative pterin-4-alpha-carbinolamine dehydratase n=2 Tax=Metallosphaera TaxID=41980 RepID=H2C395_9CREN|nr:pterin-4a-carbinolamine dehydratase [Metallosphaera yellowstonensis MK1]